MSHVSADAGLKVALRMSVILVAISMKDIINTRKESNETDEQKIIKMKDQIHQLTCKVGETVESDLHSDILTIVNENTDAIKF